MPCAGGDRQRREDAARIARRPFQHLHAAHRAADHRKQLLDAEMIDQHRLRPHHVADGDDRQVEPVWLAGRRIDRGRAGRAEAAADDVGADDEEAVGVDDLARPDQHLPPAGLAGDGIGVGDVLVGGQRMADQHGVGLGRVQRAVGLVGDLERRQQHAGVELERPLRAEAQHRAGRVVGLIAVCSGALSGHRSVLIQAGALQAIKNRRCARKAGHRANGPLATCLTWLQADRPNHHGYSCLFTARRPLRQRESFARACPPLPAESFP